MTCRSGKFARRIGHEPRRETLIRVRVHVRVVERRVHHVAVSARDRECQPLLPSGRYVAEKVARRFGMLGSCLPIAACAGAVALARPDSASVFAFVYVALP